MAVLVVVRFLMSEAPLSWLVGVQSVKSASYRGASLIRNSWQVCKALRAHGVTAPIDEHLCFSLPNLE